MNLRQISSCRWRHLAIRGQPYGQPWSLLDRPAIQLSVRYSRYTIVAFAPYRLASS